MNLQTTTPVEKKKTRYQKFLDQELKLKEYHKNYYIRNKDKWNEKSKEWRENNKEYFKNYHQKYYQEIKNNLKKLNKKSKENKNYREKNKDRLRLKCMRHYYKNRAIKKNLFTPLIAFIL